MPRSNSERVRTSRVLVSVTEGEMYHVAVDAKYARTGPVTLRWAPA